MGGGFWGIEDRSDTIYGAIQPLVKGTGDIAQPALQIVDGGLALLAGDLTLSAFEDELSTQWPASLSGNERAFRVLSAFWRIMQQAGEKFGADLILADHGPNLGAINRVGLISADYVVIPLSPDLYSLQGLRNLGPTFSEVAGSGRTASIVSRVWISNCLKAACKRSGT